MRPCGNVLNSDDELNFNTLRLQTTDAELVPLQYTKPRRIMFRAGFAF